MTLTDGKLIKLLEKSGKKKSVVEDIDEYNYILSFLFNIYNFNSDLYSVYLITNEGQIYTEFNRYGSFTYDIRKEAWYPKLEKSGNNALVIGPRVTNSTIGSKAEKQVFTLARRIYSYDGRVLGTLILDKTYKSFSNIFSEIEIEKKAQVIIRDRNKTVLYNSARANLKSSSWINSIDDRAGRDSSDNKYSRINVDGKMQLVVVDRSPYTGWDVIMAVPESNLLKNITNIRYVVIILILISILISVIIYFFLSSAVTKPVKKLTGLMKLVETGDFSVSANIHSKDEIGELAKGFNNMISRINLLLKRMVDLEVRKKEFKITAG